MEDQTMSHSFEIDKCTEQFTFRIPEILQLEVQKLSRVQKSDLIERLIVAMAQAVHEGNFNPEMYLNSKYAK